MDLNHTDIINLIPQRPPVVMIDRLIHTGEKNACGELHIKESNIFCEKGKLREPGIIEFIAQTAAAHSGYFQVLLKEEVRKGYIGSVKNLIIHELPDSGSTIQSEIIIDSEVMGFTIVLGKVFQNEKVVAECEMRIITDNRIPEK